MNNCEKNGLAGEILYVIRPSLTLISSSLLSWFTARIFIFRRYYCFVLRLDSREGTIQGPFRPL